MNHNKEQLDSLQKVVHSEDTILHRQILFTQGHMVVGRAHYN